LEPAVGFPPTGAIDAPLGPEARYEQAEAISLAFVTALQVLPPRQLAGLFVLTLAGDRICAFTRFDASVLPWFGLPRSLPSR
jgi:RNA polymerase sigma-70 factor (ECF subfamily)